MSTKAAVDVFIPPRARGLRVRTALAYVLVALVALLFIIPFVWTLATSFKTIPDSVGVGLIPHPFTTSAWRQIWTQYDFKTFIRNSLLLAVTVTAANVVLAGLGGYAFARLRFPGQGVLFYLFLLQLMLVPVLLIVPNLTLVAKLGLYDTLAGVMMPFFASAFGTFLMRQAFEAIPTELEDAALIDGAGVFQRIRHIYVPLSLPSFSAFAIVSVTSHWNDFLWPLMVINSPDKRPLTVGLSVFTATAEGTQAWGTIAAGTLMVIAPLLITFLIFQKRFISSFVTSGIK